MRQVVVTGAGGFIGKALIESLIEHGIYVIAVTSQQIEQDHCTCIHLPLEQIEELPKLIQKPIDVFYHLAWKGMSGTDLYLPEIQLKNCDFLIKCMRTAQQLGCKKFIGAGSISQFETEANSLHITKDKERYYRSCKSLCERYGNELAQELGLTFLWPIITSAYGPAGKNPDRLVYNIIKTMLRQEQMDMSEGTQIFDFVYIKDVAEAFRLIGEKGVAGKRYVVGSGNAKPLRQWIEPIPGILESQGQLNFGKRTFQGSLLDKKHFDISELTQDTGYIPKVPFESGIRMTAEALQNYMEKVRHEKLQKD